MTHTQTAAAPRIARILKLSITAGLMSVMLSACGTSDIFGTTGQITSQIPQATSQTAQTPASKVAFARIIGAPTSVSTRLTKNLIEAAAKRNLAVITNGSDKPDYTIRGYVVAAGMNTGTKLSYIWDIADKTGKRAHRITGEEILNGKNAKDPWANVTDGAINGIAEKTVGKFITWLPNKKTGASTPAVAPPASQKIANAAPAAPAYTGSLATNSGATTAFIEAVHGAPGDGKASLTNAIRQQLKAKGIRIASANTSPNYVVRGNVSMGAPSNGNQKIKIEWQVLDPNGKRLGVVSQKNVIPQGTLDGKWGGTAQAAASAASQGIVKLLPSTAKIN